MASVQLYYQFISSDSETLLVGRIASPPFLVCVLVFIIIKIIKRDFKTTIRIAVGRNNNN